MMTPEAIRQMDGPALCVLAYTLGLAPKGAWLGWPSAGDVCANRDLWRPHHDLAQADAVFRQLRARHLSCYTEYWGTAGNGKLTVYANDRGGRLLAAQMWGPGVLESSEALALLRCAVLAVVSEGGHGSCGGLKTS